MIYTTLLAPLHFLAQDMKQQYSKKDEIIAQVIKYREHSYVLFKYLRLLDDIDVAMQLDKYIQENSAILQIQNNNYISAPVEDSNTGKEHINIWTLLIDENILKGDKHINDWMNVDERRKKCISTYKHHKNINLWLMETKTEQPIFSYLNNMFGLTADGVLVSEY